jgi:hypothetical protein
MPKIDVLGAVLRLVKNEGDTIVGQCGRNKAMIWDGDGKIYLTVTV